MRTLILGLGNVLRSDEGVGVHAVEQLRTDPSVPSGTVLVDGGTQGLNLIATIAGADRLLVIDALDANQPPGTIVQLDGAELGRFRGSMSVHQLAFADLLVALSLLEERPAEIAVLGVQPLSTDWGTELSQPVGDALNAVLGLAIGQARSWSLAAEPE
jgi:hydrogenase maturation protease